jgi:hypothetical protein
MYASKFSGGDIWMLVAVIVILVLLSFLSLAEMGLSRMTRPKAMALAEQGHRSGNALVRLASDPEKWVNPILLTINVLQTVQAFLTGIVASSFGAGGAIVGLVANVVVFFILAESIPKTYAVLFPDKAALISARPTLSISRFPPVKILSKGLIGLTNWIMPGKGLQKGPFVSEQELLGIVEAAADDMVIEHEERRLIESIITFGDTTVREVMTPRPDIVTVSAFDDVTAALDIAIEHGYSRLPVLNEEDDDLVGVVYAKDLMKAEREGRGAVKVTELAHPVRFVPENKPVGDIMREMQAEKSHMTMVADEYGEFSGVVTLEDCIEELVGDIEDEFDTEELDVERRAGGDYVIEGGTSIGDVNELLSLNLPDSEWATIGGYVFGRLGHVPSLGEFVEFSGWRITVEEMLGRRIRKVRIGVLPDAQHKPPDAAGSAADGASTDGKSLS